MKFFYYRTPAPLNTVTYSRYAAGGDAVVPIFRPESACLQYS